MSFSSQFDPLFCQEDPLVPFFEENEQLYQLNEHNSDTAEFLSSLITNQHQTCSFSLNLNPFNDPYLHFARKESIQWIKATASQFGFNPLTMILAASYLDGCFLSSNGLSLQQGKPWMKQLAAIACLSLAAKVEETQVPFLLDLQLLGEKVCGFLFDSKTTRRMELLVLSTLNWRMNHVTSISFIQCILPLLKLNDHNAVEILRGCESILLSVLSDWRWVKFPPSVWASATMLHVMGQNLDGMQNIFELLQVSKEKVEECYKLMLELIGGGNKRKNCCFEPQSPSEVIGSCFSYELSSSLNPSVSSSPEQPPSKRPNCSNI